MERCYCPEARTFLAVIGLFGAYIGISLFAVAKVFENFLGVPMMVTIIILSLFTVVYTALGGLKAVVMTENIQVVFLLGGAILLTVDKADLSIISEVKKVLENHPLSIFYQSFSFSLISAALAFMA